MKEVAAPVIETIQRLAAKLLATHPVGHLLCLIGGFRYRLLNASCRASTDIDYHWDGDLDRKQAEIVDLFRQRLLPEIKRQLAYEGDVRPATGPEADSPAVRVIVLACYRLAEAGSRIELPIEITRIPRLDPPAVRTVAGTVFLTVSDADMIESKLVALLSRPFTQARDLLDLFLFQDTLRPDASQRLWRKLHERSLSPAEAAQRLDKLQVSRVVQVRVIERILNEQVDSPVAQNLRAAGGAAMIWDVAMRVVRDVLAAGKELDS